MELEKQVCSLELAKKLKELGAKQESYFVWCEYPPASPPWTMKWAVARTGDIDDYAYEHHREVVSAFTVAELGEMLPDREITTFMHKGTWYCEYTMGEGLTKHDGDEANARAKMLIYLIQNKLITATTTA